MHCYSYINCKGLPCETAFKCINECCTWIKEDVLCNLKRIVIIHNENKAFCLGCKPKNLYFIDFSLILANLYVYQIKMDCK